MVKRRLSGEPGIDVDADTLGSDDYFKLYVMILCYQSTRKRTATFFLIFEAQ